MTQNSLLGRTADLRLHRLYTAVTQWFRVGGEEVTLGFISSKARLCAQCSPNYRL